MAKYHYVALKNGKDFVKGEVEAYDLRDARQKIRSLGFTPTKVYTEEQELYTPVQTKKQVSLVKLKMAEKIMFTSELEVLLSSGIPILEALTTIASHVHREKVKNICLDLFEKINSGMTFAQSLEKYYTETFGSVYTGIVKAGEESGELVEALGRMLDLLRKQDQMIQKINFATLYPKILLVIIAGLLVLFSKVVFPAFLGIMTYNQADVPFLAQTLIGGCDFIANFWWFILLLIGAAFGACKSLFKNLKFKYRWDEFLLQIPYISDLVKYINLSNFMRVMHISYDAGVPVIPCLELSVKTIGNLSIKDKVFAAVNIVRCGNTLTSAFERTQAIPPELISMVSAGEKSGTLGKMLLDAANVLDKKVDMALETVMRMIEPVTIVLIAGVVLYIAVAFIQLYYGMLGSLF